MFDLGDFEDLIFSKSGQLYEVHIITYTCIFSKFIQRKVFNQKRNKEHFDMQNHIIFQFLCNEF